MPDFAPIVITRVANLITIRPVSYASILIPHLTWARQERNNDWTPQTDSMGRPVKKSYYKVVNEPMYRQTDHELVTFAGFRFKVYDILRQYAPVTFEDPRDPKWLFPEPDTSNLGMFKHKQLEAIQAVWNGDGGIIHCSTAWGKTEEIAKICRSYAYLEDYPIIVVAPGKEILDTIVKRLASYNIDAGHVDGSHDRRRPITVCSAFSLPKMEDDGGLKNCRLVLFDEVHRCAAPRIRQSLIRMENARMFGLTATLEGRVDQGEIVTEAFFGRRICHVEYQEAVDNDVVSPMYVLMVETTGPHMDFKEPQSKTRHGIWRNTSRNQIFASIATQLVEMGQTLILTETLEHAVNIYKMLPPGWVMVFGNHPSTKLRTETRKFEKKQAKAKTKDPFSKEPRTLVRAKKMTKEFEDLGIESMTPKRREELASQFAKGEIRGAVATSVWGVGVDFPLLQFILRVDGSASEIRTGQYSGRASRKAEGKTVGIVIDGEDKFDESLTRRKQSRVRVYKKNGWDIQRGVAPAEVATMCHTILGQ